jgi:hypothetical protein
MRTRSKMPDWCLNIQGPSKHVEAPTNHLCPRLQRYPWERTNRNGSGMFCADRVCSSPCQQPQLCRDLKCDHATALQLIEATGRQTREPIGIVLGQDPTLLSKTRQTYNLEQVDTRSALLEAIAGTGYSLRASNGVFALIAGDLTSRQQQVLDHEYPDFRSDPHQTMVQLGVQLTMWMSEIDGASGFAVSILGATNDERFTLGTMATSITEEIADRIVSLGSKGMWILTMDTFDRTGEWTDGVEIEPYQHYSNLPIADR